MKKFGFNGASIIRLLEQGESGFLLQMSLEV
ncbi:hypothetical protein SAMN04515695_5737 [Pseudovibrio sp. Tun.PSC04-5.I4]|nr:hypothetical protein SAMN04515695_5737 [Pseudovibrio sp. Tun.PSC04-5.I4]